MKNKKFYHISTVIKTPYKNTINTPYEQDNRQKE